MQSRIALLVLLALPLGFDFAAPATRIRFAPAEGLALRKTFENRSQQKLDWVRVTMSGREREQDHGQESESTSRLVVVDSYVSVAAERVARLERSYEDFEGAQTTEVTVGGDGRTIKSETSCQLVGYSVAFIWNPDAEAYVASCADEEVEADWLEDLNYDLEFFALLPADEVEAGDEWEVDAKAFRSVLRFEQGLPLEAESIVEGETQEPRDEDVEEPDAKESVSGALTARFAGTREEDGALLALIELSGEYQVSSESDRITEVENGTETARIHQTTNVDLEGEFLWNLAADHFQAGTLEAESETRTSVDISIVMINETMEFSQESSASGSVNFSARFVLAE